MNKKKLSKKELFDIIKIQEEEISRLNKEKMNFNVVIRNEKPIRIDTQGLDYMVDLEQKYYVLQDIIKEVREWAKKCSCQFHNDNEELIVSEISFNIQARPCDLFKILDKENKEWIKNN